MDIDQQEEQDTTMCIPEQHREPTTRAISRVEWHINNTHSSEVNTRNLFFSQSGGQVYQVFWGEKVTQV